MSARSMLSPRLGPVVRGVALTSVLAVPAVALGAPDGDGAADDGKAGKSKKSKGKKKGGSSEAGADASVSTSGASAKRGGNKGAAMKGRFGLGAMRSLSGLNGLWGRYYLANRVTLGLTAGFATFSHRDTDDTGEFNRTRTVGALAIGPELFFWPVQGPRSQQVHADFGAGVRVLTYVGFLGLSEEEQSNTLDTPVEIDIEIPAKIQLFIGQRVSINPEFGVAFRIIPGDREPDGNGDFDMNPGTGAGQRLGSTNGPGFGFELGNHAGLFMGIGVGFYFGKLAE
ncbi:MAG: hypothetical protein AB1Z98_02515 [Nannocystaceae bacterium]